MKTKPVTIEIMIVGIASLGLLFGLSGQAIAQMTHSDMYSPTQTAEFQQLDQPLWLKGMVTAGGLGLISLELWWFLFSKPKS